MLSTNLDLRLLHAINESPVSHLWFFFGRASNGFSLQTVDVNQGVEPNPNRSFINRFYAIFVEP